MQNLFQATARSLSFDLPQDRRLFTNISFTLTTQKYALVGPNGVGKSTLAKILASKLLPSAGELKISQNVIYLAQEESRSAISVAEYLMDLWDSSVIERAVWRPLLENIQLESSLSTLSGGEWMRVRIAHAISQPAGLLILDEPTNNLDARARKQIHRFVENFSGPLLIISHDRELLNKASTILELSNQGLSTFGGNFDFYLQQKSLEQIRQRQNLDRLRLEKKKTEKELHKKISSQEKRMREGVKQAPKKGLPKILLGARKRLAQETHGRVQKNENQRLQKAEGAFMNFYNETKQESAFNLALPQSQIPSGKMVFEILDFNFSFSANASPLWTEKLNLTMKGPRRWALAGDNGSGKSTLLKLLLANNDEVLGFCQGMLRLGEVQVAILDQEYRILDHNLSVLENVAKNSALTKTEIRNQLARFQLFADQPLQKVSSLGGGEKLKAALAKIFLAKETVQFLILDEPTNNLDLQSLEILEKALSSFAGALLVVSHDQRFLENVGIERVYTLVKQGAESP
jgi:ATPase subunit of ABC transporter with duplicated ATPase domains